MATEKSIFIPSRRMMAWEESSTRIPGRNHKYLFQTFVIHLNHNSEQTKCPISSALHGHMCPLKIYNSCSRKHKANGVGTIQNFISDINNRKLLRVVAKFCTYQMVKKYINPMVSMMFYFEKNVHFTCWGRGQKGCSF